MNGSWYLQNVHTQCYLSKFSHLDLFGHVIHINSIAGDNLYTLNFNKSSFLCVHNKQLLFNTFYDSPNFHWKITPNNIGFVSISCLSHFILFDNTNIILKYSDPNDAFYCWKLIHKNKYNTDFIIYHKHNYIGWHGYSLNLPINHIRIHLIKSDNRFYFVKLFNLFYKKYYNFNNSFFTFKLVYINHFTYHISYMNKWVSYNSDSNILYLSDSPFEWFFVPPILYHKHNLFHIVVARYRENISWCSSFSKLVTIYNKGPPIFNIDTIHLHNIGRESHTYLYHIIKNYHNLAEKTLFVQGNGGFDHDILPYHKYSSDDNITMNINVIANTYCQNNWGHLICNGKELSMLKNGLFVHSNNTLYSFWTNFIRKNVPPIKTYKWSQGACFSVSKKTILKNPLSYYVNLIKAVNYSINPEEGHYFERSWYYIFSLPYYTFYSRFILKKYFFFLKSYKKI